MLRFIGLVWRLFTVEDRISAAVHALISSLTLVLLSDVWAVAAQTMQRIPKQAISIQFNSIQFNSSDKRQHIIGSRQPYQC
jgi:hypothetical protein